MAFVCLSYLSHSRYSTFPPESSICPSSRLLEEKANEDRNIYDDCDNPRDIFLKYAAIFWHRHADAAEPATDLYAPYHFGTFISTDVNGTLYLRVA